MSVDVAASSTVPDMFVPLCMLVQSLQTNAENALSLLQAWLVPVADDSSSSGAALHSGFSASWQQGLRQLVCDLITSMLSSQAQAYKPMRLLITGTSPGADKCSGSTLSTLVSCHAISRHVHESMS